MPDKIIPKIRATPGLMSKIARACGIQRQAVQQWDRVPPARAHKVAEIMGLTVEQIRPDIFKAPRKS